MKLRDWYSKNKDGVEALVAFVFLIAMLGGLLYVFHSVPDAEPSYSASITLENGTIIHCDYVTTWQGVVRAHDCSDGLDYLGGITGYTQYGKTTIVQIE